MMSKPRAVVGFKTKWLIQQLETRRNLNISWRHSTIYFDTVRFMYYLPHNDLSSWNRKITSYTKHYDQLQHYYHLAVLILWPNNKQDKKKKKIKIVLFLCLYLFQLELQSSFKPPFLFLTTQCFFQIKLKNVGAKSDTFLQWPWKFISQTRTHHSKR